MKFPPLFIGALVMALLASSSPAAKPFPDFNDGKIGQRSPTEQAKLGRVYQLTATALNLAKGKSAVPEGDLFRTGKGLSRAAFKQECTKMADECSFAVASAEKRLLPEIAMYIKQANHRLIEDQEEPPEWHIAWCKKQPPDKVYQNIRYNLDRLKKGLGGL